jgi:predicted O-methyltransferase YrrM
MIMEYAKLSDYIEGLYQHDTMIGQAEFIEKTGLKKFCPVIETETARFLMLLLRLKAPKKVLEIGTSIGYSTTSMAQIVKEWKGCIVTIEFDEKVAEYARKNFERWGVADVVELIIGDARTVLPVMEEKFDFIFLDPYNDIYPLLYEDCIKLLNKGGLLIADDTLEPILEAKEANTPLHEYNKLVTQNANLESTIVAVGDGVTLAVKK